VPRGRFGGTDYAIEPDASSASYFLGLAAIHPGSRVSVHNLGRHSLQGDARFIDVLGRMGAEVEQTADRTTVTGPSALDGVEVDLSAMPDLAQTLAVIALFAAGETTLRGLRTLRVKETDRVEALRTELTKLGAEVKVEESENDVSLMIIPPYRLQPATIATYDDHRMAMSFALATTKRAGIEIENPACVSKTYPGFFDDLTSVTNVSRPE
jgi:3-phosphoshikimate 1-carboxyvinyltransferase